ncbi:MAG: DUF559 domain-containing protein [Gemmatimonadaceae bacterium]|nr:DUF559 domain-containing protein [Gemmatimonadaceae bacterium]
MAVFVDGDYWHGRLLPERGLEALESTLRTPTRGYWLAKFQRNVARDDYVTGILKRQGWIVLRFWESDIKRDVLPTARQVAQAVKRRRQTLG